MSGAHSDPSFVQDARLRTSIATIARAISCLSSEGTAEDHRAATRDLVVSWAGLVELLALRPPPETRECPRCNHTGMRAATRCGYCWAVLSSPPPSTVGPS